LDPVSGSTAIGAATSGVAWPTSTSRLPAKSIAAARAVRLSEALRSQCPAAQRIAVTGTVRAERHPESYGKSDPLLPQLASKRKLWAVAASPICGQQIGKMRA